MLPIKHDGQTVALRSSGNVLHLDLDCDSLAPMRDNGVDPLSKLTPVPYRKPTELVTSRGAALCRLCGVAPTVTHLLTHADKRYKDVFLTFSNSRPPDGKAKVRNTDPDTLRRLAMAASTRMNGICAATGLQTTTTGRGPVAYGFVPRGVLPTLEKLVRTEVRRTVTEMPPPMLVATFWSLLSEDTIQVAGADPWFIAEQICA